MMTQCPKCGSTEIIPDLILFGDAVTHNTPALLFMVTSRRFTPRAPSCASENSMI